MTPKLKKRGAWPGFEGVAKQGFANGETKSLATSLDALGATTKQALIDVERNTSDAVDALAKGYKPAWTPVTTSTNYQAQLWDLVIARAGCTILLPSASLANIGAEVAVLKVGAVTLSITPINGLINGASTDAGPSTDRARIYISSGEGWFSLA